MSQSVLELKIAFSDHCEMSITLKNNNHWMQLDEKQQPDLSNLNLYQISLCELPQSYQSNTKTLQTGHTLFEL
jgi:hypothetical protein